MGLRCFWRFLVVFVCLALRCRLLFHGILPQPAGILSPPSAGTVLGLDSLFTLHNVPCNCAIYISSMILLTIYTLMSITSAATTSLAILRITYLIKCDIFKHRVIFTLSK